MFSCLGELFWRSCQPANATRPIQFCKRNSDLYATWPPTCTKLFVRLYLGPHCCSSIGGAALLHGGRLRSVQWSGSALFRDWLLLQKKTSKVRPRRMDSDCDKWWGLEGSTIKQPAVDHTVSGTRRIQHTRVHTCKTLKQRIPKEFVEFQYS
jgi:hypothetical protein